MQFTDKEVGNMKLVNSHGGSIDLIISLRTYKCTVVIGIVCACLACVCPLSFLIMKSI